MNVRHLPIALVAVLSSFIAGCSFLFVHGPPSGYESLDSFDCTEGNGVPIADVVGAGLFIALGIIAATEEDEPFVPDVRAAVAIGSFGLVVGFGSSAVVGFGKTSRCREAHRILRERGASTSLDSLSWRTRRLSP